ncbi:MAG: hypothetical protein ACTSR4_07005, partial [Candidatus Hodarchaeales archaeon]
YIFDFKTGDWLHHAFQDVDLQEFPNIKTVLRMNLKNCFDEDDIDRKTLFAQYLNDARKIAKKLQDPDSFNEFQNPAAEELRWFNFQKSINE